MRIGNAMKYTGKILNFVKELAESDSSIYDKTRDKLIMIGDMCAEIQQIITEALETTKPRGFNPNTIEKTDEKIDTLDERVDNVETEVDNVCASLETKPKYTKQTAKTNDTSNPDRKHKADVRSEHKHSSDRKSFITSSDSKKALHIYAKTLEEAAQTDHNNATLNRCCGLIWKWFDSRFLNQSKNKRTYKYDVRNIKDYIAGLVISFGHHIEAGDFENYAEKIEIWINSDRAYLYPYEVKAICKDRKFEYANTTAIILWRTLVESCGYDSLGKITLSNCKIPDVRGLVFVYINEIEDTVNKGGIYTDQSVDAFDDPYILEKYNII